MARFGDAVITGTFREFRLFDQLVQPRPHVVARRILATHHDAEPYVT